MTHINNIVTIQQDSPELYRHTPESAGFDLRSSEYLVLNPNSRSLINTGISLSMPSGIYGRIASRSGLSIKHGIEVGAGVIDPDYTGTIKVLLYNLSDELYTINIGDRIAQLIFEYYITPSFQRLEKLPSTNRGTSGLGISGIQ